MKTVDMSPQAISRRLEELNQLWELCVTLQSSRIVAGSATMPGKVSDAQPSMVTDHPRKDLHAK
jgi:hypothetical protein